MIVTVSPGVTTENPALWLAKARERGRRLRALVDAQEARPALLAQWETDVEILAAEIRRVLGQMETMK